MPHTTSRHGCYTLAKRSGKSISSKERESGRAGQGDWGTLKKRLACSGASPKLVGGDKGLVNSRFTEVVNSWSCTSRSKSQAISEAGSRKLDCSDVHTLKEDSDHVLNESSDACCSNHKIGRSLNLGKLIPPSGAGGFIYTNASCSLSWCLQAFRTVFTVLVDMSLIHIGRGVFAGHYRTYIHLQYHGTRGATTFFDPCEVEIIVVVNTLRKIACT
ncbi:predicted protein [Histoplasma capsulatum G186AR]|uniref:Uncharacterized protein n=1 Tax=Ajellomyces capsulatus (strain G186AR / H82 / ATCC MYA-2454 / RMSCC 2432) TaxID=447093 RepID=C0P1D8_AJECG|nr:uncharacterized protein HCBG_09218 [Histoplasma capsulatum G186AR]EEH02539.1 predicted protein [Histoplasma capsulatum G186AR]